MIIPKWAVDAFLIVVGSLCVAFAIAAFLLPHRIVAGGPPGLAVLVNHLLDISPGLVILSINGVLMVLGLRSLGGNFLIRTLVAVALIALLTDLLQYGLKDVSITADRFLNALYAGVFLGVGVGLLFRGGGSSGGWSILARLVADRAHIGVGQAAVILDTVIVLISATVFREPEAALLGGITVFVTGQLIDKLMTPRPSTRLVHVSSRHSNELQAVIDAQFGIRGMVVRCDAAAGEGGKDLLYLNIDRRHLKTLVAMIKDQAPDAYVTVADAVDMSGHR
ncbi:MAG: YitT family protein [Motiliproteus sp.]